MDLKSEAIKFRKSGKSYGEIRKELGLPKSTLSYWLKAIKLDSNNKRRLYKKQILILNKGAKSQKERRQKVVNKIIKLAVDEIKLPLDENTLKLIGVCMYWAEGSKSKMMQITNSDPNFILFFTRWLKKVFNIEPKNLKVYLNLYQQQDEIKIKHFWSNLTNIPLLNFGKTYFKPLSSNYKQNNLYYGTLRLYVPKSVDLKYKMQGWLKALLHEVEIDVKSTEQRWLTLEETKRAVNLPR